MVQDPDGKTPELEEDPDLAEEDGEDEGDSGEDQAGLALNTPEPARAKMASMPVEKGKDKTGKGKFKKDKLKDSKAGVEVKLTDAALGLSDSEEKKPEESTQEQSAFDRDEITDPEVSEDIIEDNIDPLAMLAGAGLQTRAWENEKLSLMERMTMREGYGRNPDAPDKEGQDKGDTKARGKKAQGPNAVKTAATAAVAVAVATGVVMGAARTVDKKPDGPSMSGINQGPRRQADQDQAQTGSDFAKHSKTEQIRIEARENATDVTMRRFDRGLASSFAMQQKLSEPASSTSGPELDDLADLSVEEGWEQDTGTQLQASNINWAPAQDADTDFRARMDQLMMAIGLENLSPVTPYREEMWSVKLMEYNENTADVTTAPEPPAPDVPVPDLTFRQEPKFNFGPGGPG